MIGSHPYRHPATIDEALAIQRELRVLVEAVALPGFAPRTATGLDVAYANESTRLAAAVSVLDIATLAPVDSAVVHGSTDFPYQPGLFAFRELPALLAALGELSVCPDVLLCDGHGIAHPRRLGLASHLGVITGIPTIGVAKTPMGMYDAPGIGRGEWTPLIDDGETVGRVLRTQDGTKPVFVSVGHRIDLATAADLVLRLAPRFRLPETTRRADHAARRALADQCP